MASVNCSCSPSKLQCCTPWYAMETPIMRFKDADVPFWVWLVVAGGVLLVILILVLIILLCCLYRAQRNYFWCCCFSDDDATTNFVDNVANPDDFVYGRRGDGGGGKRSQILYRYPEDDAANLGYTSGQAVNGNYVPRAQRLTSDRSRVVEDGLAASGLGGRKSNGPVVTEYIDIDDQSRRGGNNQPTVVAIGKPSSVISSATGPKPPSVVGNHSAALQIGSSGGAAAAVSIWPSL